MVTEDVDVSPPLTEQIVKAQQTFRNYIVDGGVSGVTWNKTLNLGGVNGLTVPANKKYNIRVTIEVIEYDDTIV